LRRLSLHMRCSAWFTIASAAHALVLHPAVPAANGLTMLRRPYLPAAGASLPGARPLAGCQPRSSSVQMQEAPFWENVVRFMRFGVTSVTGLIAGLLSPFAAFLRTPTLTAIGSVLLVSFLAFIYLTLQGMQSQVTFPGAPSGAGIMSAQEVPMEPSMKRMMNDIYGEEQ